MLCFCWAGICRSCWQSVTRLFHLCLCFLISIGCWTKVRSIAHRLFIHLDQTMYDIQKWIFFHWIPFMITRTWNDSNCGKQRVYGVYSIDNYKWKPNLFNWHWMIDICHKLQIFIYWLLLFIVLYTKLS